MEKQTDKGLVIGLFVDEPPEAPEVKKSVVTESVVAEQNEAEAPTVEAEVVAQEETPRRRGRPRKIIE